MPRISSINKKSKKTKDFFANRISASEDTDTVFEQSEALAKKIKEDKENEINAAIKTSLSFAVPKEKINNNKLKNSFLTKKQSRQSSPNPLPVKKDPPSNDKTTDITADTSADKTKENKNIFSHKTHKNPRLTTDISADNFFQTNNLTTIEESPLLSPSPTQKDTSLSKK